MPSGAGGALGGTGAGGTGPAGGGATTGAAGVVPEGCGTGGAPGLATGFFTGALQRAGSFLSAALRLRLSLIRRARRSSVVHDGRFLRRGRLTPGVIGRPPHGVEGTP